jgi:hypothetical protein
MPFKDSEFRTPEKEKNSGEGKGEHERKNHAPARPPALRSLEGLAPAGSANWDGSNHENPVWQGIYAHYANVSPHKSAAELIRMADEEFARRQGA